ncbi:retrovirus-related pol polyprotein from transposon TNT 1-94 [Tanacetum coccineum]
MIVKVGHKNVNESVKKALLKSWVIDSFEEALDPDKDLIERSFDDYKWVFDLEIEKLPDESKLRIGKKGHSSCIEMGKLLEQSNGRAERMVVPAARRKLSRPTRPVILWKMTAQDGDFLKFSAGLLYFICSVAKLKWQSSFLRHIDTRTNGDALRKCILEGPYQLTTVTIPAGPVTDDSPAALEQTAVETLLNMSSERLTPLITNSGKRKTNFILAIDTSELWQIKSTQLLMLARQLMTCTIAIATLPEDPYFNTMHQNHHKSYAPTSKQSSSTRSNATTKLKGKEIAKPITTPFESASEEDTLQTYQQQPQNFFKLEKQECGYYSKVVQQSGIQCFNCKEFGHFAKECRKQKRVKDYTYQKEKMLMCKKAEKGVPLQAKQADWLEGTNKEIDKQELEEHYSFMAKIQIGVDKEISKLTQNTETELDMYMAFNDCTVDYDKLECKLNETLGLLAQKEIDIKEGLKLKAYEILVVKEKHDELVKQSLLTKSHYKGLIKEKTKVITDLKSKEEKDIDKMISMENHIKFLNEIVYKRNQSIQTIHMLAPKGSTFNGRPTFENLMYLKKAQYESHHSHDHFHAPTAHDMEILIKTCLMPLALKTQKDSFTFVHELKQEIHAELKYVESLEKEIDELESDKA